MEVLPPREGGRFARPALAAKARRTACMATRSAWELNVVIRAATWISGCCRRTCKVQTLSLPLLHDKATFVTFDLRSPVVNLAAHRIRSAANGFLRWFRRRHGREEFQR